MNKRLCFWCLREAVTQVWVHDGTGEIRWICDSHNPAFVHGNLVRSGFRKLTDDEFQVAIIMEI